MASVSYDHNARLTGYKIYAQSKASIPTAPNFEPACNSVTSGNPEMGSPTSYQSSSPSQRRSEQGITSEIFISSRYAKQNNLLPSINNHNQPALRLRDGTKITFV